MRLTLRSEIIPTTSIMDEQVQALIQEHSDSVEQRLGALIYAAIDRHVDPMTATAIYQDILKTVREHVVGAYPPIITDD